MPESTVAIIEPAPKSTRPATEEIGAGRALSSGAAPVAHSGNQRLRRKIAMPASSIASEAGSGTFEYPPPQGRPMSVEPHSAQV